MWKLLLRTFTQQPAQWSSFVQTHSGLKCWETGVDNGNISTFNTRYSSSHLVSCLVCQARECDSRPPAWLCRSPWWLDGSAGWVMMFNQSAGAHISTLDTGHWTRDFTLYIRQLLSRIFSAHFCSQAGDNLSTEFALFYGDDSKIVSLLTHILIGNFHEISFQHGLDQCGFIQEPARSLLVVLSFLWQICKR